MTVEAWAPIEQGNNNGRKSRAAPLGNLIGADGNAGVIAGGDGRPAFVRIDDSAIRSFIPASRSGFGGLTGLVGGAPDAAENFSNAANSILAGAAPAQIVGAADASGALAALGGDAASAQRAGDDISQCAAQKSNAISALSRAVPWAISDARRTLRKIKKLQDQVFRLKDRWDISVLPDRYRIPITLITERSGVERPIDALNYANNLIGGVIKALQARPNFEYGSCPIRGDLCADLGGDTITVPCDYKPTDPARGLIHEAAHLAGYVDPRGYNAVTFVYDIWID